MPISSFLPTSERIDPQLSKGTLAENPACNPACGVCHYKHLDYPAQLARKQAWAQSQLKDWEEVLQGIRSAPPGERVGYRSKSWMRTSFSVGHVDKAGEDVTGTREGGDVSFGMVRSVKVGGRWGKELISWDRCPLHVEAIQEMLERLRKLVSEGNPRGLEPEFLSWMGIWLGSPHLVLVSKEAGLREFVQRTDWSRILVPPFDQVWFHVNSQVGRRVFGHQPIELVWGTPQGGTEASVHPIRAFRQIAQTLLKEARALAVEKLLRSKPSLVLDLYCGTGDLSLLIPPETGWIGIELAQEAVAYANALRPSSAGASAHRAFTGGVEQRLRDPQLIEMIPKNYALSLNPPRSGLTEEARDRVLALIRERRPNAIVYLSCSASSLARDLRVFTSVGFQVKGLQPYDFFPQTEHFETLALLEP